MAQAMFRSAEKTNENELWRIYPGIANKNCVWILEDTLRKIQIAMSTELVGHMNGREQELWKELVKWEDKEQTSGDIPGEVLEALDQALIGLWNEEKREKCGKAKVKETRTKNIYGENNK